MPERMPSQSALTDLLGPSLFAVWQALCSTIDQAYEMEQIWGSGGKNLCQEDSCRSRLEVRRTFVYGRDAQ